MRHDSSLSDLQTEITRQLEDSALLKRAVGQSEAETVARMVGGMADLYRRGGTLLVCGNGGSSADAQHMAGELVGRFLMERRALDCIALTTDSSVITAMANDYGYDTIFSRQVEAHGREGDILFAISTSGNSSNVLKAVEAARRLKMNVFALSGRDGGALAGKADVCLTVPSRECPRIQEIHITVIHIICDLVERMLFGT